MKDTILALLMKFKLALTDERGQSLVEYALIIALVAVVAIITLTALGVKITTIFTSITGSL